MTDNWKDDETIEAALLRARREGAQEMLDKIQAALNILKRQDAAPSVTVEGNRVTNEDMAAIMRQLTITSLEAVSNTEDGNVLDFKRVPFGDN